MTVETLLTKIAQLAIFWMAHLFRLLTQKTHVSVLK